MKEEEKNTVEQLLNIIYTFSVRFFFSASMLFIVGGSRLLRPSLVGGVLCTQHRRTRGSFIKPSLLAISILFGQTSASAIVLVAINVWSMSHVISE